MLLLWILCIILAVIAVLLSIKIYLLKKSMNEICTEFKQSIAEDTNVQVTVSSGDTTARNLAKTINQELSHLHKLKQQYSNGDRELKNAVTNISHDLRTPLTAICGYLDLMQKTDSREDLERYLFIMKERTELMKQLTEELFRYSVILSDHAEIEIHEVNVGQMLEDSIMDYYGALDERGITPDVHITEQKILRNLNKDYVSRIFANLLNNALKYSDGDLDITLSDTGEITFINTAKELSAIQAEQLFERFYTVESARSSTGLGLSIARTLVERMGGQITAEYSNDRLTIQIIF